MPQALLYFTPQQVLSVVVYGMLAASNGDLTIDSTDDLHEQGSFQGFRLDPNRGNIEISPVDGEMENMQPTKGSFRLTISELVRPGYDPVLTNIYENYDYIGVVLTPHLYLSETPGKSIAVVATILDCPLPVEGNPTVVTLTGGPCGNKYQRSMSPTLFD